MQTSTVCSMSQLKDPWLCFMIVALVSNRQLLTVFCFYKRKLWEGLALEGKRTTLSNIAIEHSAVGALVAGWDRRRATLVMRNVLQVSRKKRRTHNYGNEGRQGQAAAGALRLHGQTHSVVVQARSLLSAFTTIGIRWNTGITHSQGLTVMQLTWKDGRVWQNLNLSEKSSSEWMKQRKREAGAERGTWDSWAFL